MYEIRGIPLIKRISDAAGREINNRVRAQGVTMSQAQLLLRLEEAENGKISFKELERRLAVSQATVAGIVKRMKMKDLVEVCDDHEDGRVKHAQITDAGRAICAEAHEHMDAMELMLVDALSEEEARLFLEHLYRVSETF